MWQDLLRNKHIDVKAENDDDNPASPYVDVEALSDGDEKVECETGSVLKHVFYNTCRRNKTSCIYPV